MFVFNFFYRNLTHHNLSLLSPTKALYFFSLCLCLLLAPAIAGEVTQTNLEKYSWTLGYSPDEIIDYYEPTPDTKLGLHVFYPKDHQANEQRTCVVFFYGGGWKSGDPSQFYGYSKYLASRGIVAISAQYRNARAHNAIPRECVEDGREAIRYIREHAKELGIDPNKVVAGGGSAGGHVAASIAMCTAIDANPISKTKSIPNGLILLNPVYNNGPEGGYGYDRVQDYWKEISPYHNIQKGQPATICFFGTNDIHVPISTVEAFQNEMEKVGNDCKTHIYEGQKHGFFHISKGGRIMFEDVLTKIDRFLVKNHYLKGENKVSTWTAEAIAHYQASKKSK